jgi:hypothetical protein
MQVQLFGWRFCFSWPSDRTLVGLLAPFLEILAFHRSSETGFALLPSSNRFRSFAIMKLGQPARLPFGKF